MNSQRISDCLCKLSNAVEGNRKTGARFSCLEFILDDTYYCLNIN